LTPAQDADTPAQYADTPAQSADEALLNRKPKRKLNEKPSVSFFDEFWKSFPSTRKDAPIKCKKLFEQAVKDGTDPSVIVQAAKEYAQSWKATTEWVLGPCRWLEEGHWSDDRKSWDNPKLRSDYSDPSYKPFEIQPQYKLLQSKKQERVLPEVSIEEFVTQWNSVLNRTDDVGDDLKTVMQEKLKEHWWRRFWYEVIDETLLREKRIASGSKDSFPKERLELDWVFGG